MEPSKFDEVLILSVQGNEHLYNKKLPFYKDDRMKENTWLSIAEMLSTDPETAKRRWENLRDRFVRAYREASKPGGSCAQTKPTVFRYYELMQWLIPFLRKRKLTASLALASEPDTELCIPDVNVEVGDGTYSVNEEGRLVQVDKAATSSPSTSSTVGRRSSGTSHSDSNEPRSKRMATKAVSSSTSVMETKFSQPSAFEADISFMKSLVSDMQLLSREKKVLFKRNVYDLLNASINNE